MTAQQFTSEEQASFAQAVKYRQAYLATLNDYQKARLADLAREKVYRVVQVQTERFARHPYAPQEAGHLDYWLTTSQDYVAAQEILALLAEPAPTAATAVAPTATELPHRANKKQLATLQPPLTVEAIKAILNGLPVTITKEGEVAAALSSLVASGKLIGDASKVHRWCEAANILPLPDRKTVYNKMQNSEETQFKNPIERSIFSKVLKQVKALA